MRVSKWTRANAVHLPEIDAEHRAIYRAAGDLQHGIEAGASRGRILELLHAVAATIEDHFTHEERLMREARYESYAWHVQQHNAARRRFMQSIGEVEAGAHQSAALLVDYLSGWLRNHTSVADRMMGAYLRNYNRSHAA